MEEIPDFWRPEVYHPLSVHFPIALLTVAFLFKILALRFKREVWELGGTVLLSMGVIGIWLAIYTGDLADGIVSRELCDPTVLKEHQNTAWTTAWIFTSGMIIDLLRYIEFPVFKKMIFLVVVTTILAVGTALLTYVGHLGATLVYQQAAGVHVPSSDCAEYE